jgi:MFS family permease
LARGADEREAAPHQTTRSGEEATMPIEGMFRSRWWIVFASVMGLIGGGSMTVFVFSVFIRPVTAEFGWSRGEFGGALGLSSLAGAIAFPLFGRLLDKYGIRAVLLPAIVAFALATASMAALRASVPMLFAIYVLIGIAGAAQSPVPYSKVITGWFDDYRGLALGIAIAGSGLGTALMPLLAQTLTSAYGWRAGYAGLGIAFFIVAFPPVLLFMREMPQAAARRDSAALPGATAREALKSGRFWLLFIAFWCGITPVNGVLTQAVALLSDRGMPVREAAGALAISGLVVIASRLVAGFLMDRFHGPIVGIAFFGVSLIGVVLLALGVTGGTAILGTVLCGVAVGAEVDLMGFLVSRYFGLKAFGTIFGYIFVVLPIGVGAGSALMGFTYDHAHSYEPMLIGFIVMMLIACVLLLRLGAYVYPRSARGEPIAIVEAESGVA